MMVLTDESLGSENIGDVIQFIQEANPQNQYWWGWDTGRFICWRFGSNCFKHKDSLIWFSENCHLFRYNGKIVGTVISESGRGDVCILLKNPDLLDEMLQWTEKSWGAKSGNLSFEIWEGAHLLLDAFKAAGYLIKKDTSIEWKYDLETVEKRYILPKGYSLDSLHPETESDFKEITEVIKEAFQRKIYSVDILKHLEKSPLFFPKLNIVVRCPEGYIVAYLRGIIDDTNGICSIDPVCCLPDFQRKGLSKGLVRECFQRQKDLGGKVSFIGSAPRPAAGTFLYESLGPSKIFSMAILFKHFQ